MSFDTFITVALVGTLLACAALAALVLCKASALGDKQIREERDGARRPEDP